MRRRAIRLLALGTLVFAANIGSAQAASIITFEDLALDESGGDKISGGFFFDTANDHSHITNGSWGTTNGSKSMMVDGVGGIPHLPEIGDDITFSQVGGALFGLTSIDISEAAALFTYAHQVEVTGHLFGGGTVSTVLDLDDNFDENVTANYFQTFTFDAQWNNLSSVVLKGTGSQAVGGNYYAIDNVVVSSAVPEPGTLTLVGLGSAYLVRRRRRTRP